jgi:glycerol kinase
MFPSAEFPLQAVADVTAAVHRHLDDYAGEVEDALATGASLLSTTGQSLLRANETSTLCISVPKTTS